jgi:predicted alpha/beta-fold hydrolase
VLVGNSLGANLVTKYLGEEGLAGSLPRSVVAGVSLGNPFRFRADRLRFPFGTMIGAARKANYFLQRKAMALTNANNVHRDPHKLSLASLDRALAATMIRTASHPPYETTIGYGHNSGNEVHNAASSPSTGKHITTVKQEATAEAAAADAYWADSSCYRQGRHVSVPLVHVIARDDTLCYESAKHHLGYSLENPNVMVVQTRTGGHLGWWHRPSASSAKPSSWWGLNSWADEATADFIQAVLDTQSELGKPNHHRSPATRPIDDAYKLFTANQVNDTGKTISVQALRGDRDGDSNSTIATNGDNDDDPSDFHHRHIIRNNNQSGRQPPSGTYFRFRKVLLLQQREQSRSNEEKRLARNRLLEKDEAIALARLVRSRL